MAGPLLSASSAQAVPAWRTLSCPHGPPDTLAPGPANACSNQRPCGRAPLLVSLVTWLYSLLTGNRLWQPGRRLAGRQASSGVWWGVAPEPSLLQTCKRPCPLNQGSPTFLAPGTSFLEGSLPADQGSGGTVSVSPAGHVLPSGRFRTGRWPTPALGPWLGDPCIEPLVCAWALTFVSYYNAWPHMSNISKRPYKKRKLSKQKACITILSWNTAPILPTWLN